MALEDTLTLFKHICARSLDPIRDADFPGWQTILGHREQLKLRWPYAVRQAVADVCSRATNPNLINFLIDNKFHQETEYDHNTSENPVLAPIYNTSTIAPEVSMVNKLTVFFSTRLVECLTASQQPVQEAFLNRITQFLPDSPIGAALFKKALNAAPAGATHMLFMHVQNIPPLGWKEHLAEVLFNHPSMVPHIYKAYAADYEARAGGILNFSHYANEALKKWREVDKRLVAVRKARTAANWRRAFWASVVFQWRKREFKERYYAPDGPGAAVAAARFYASLNEVEAQLPDIKELSHWGQLNEIEI
jgi:hypothetical protein